jgi:hypothetical protein
MDQNLSAGPISSTASIDSNNKVAVKVAFPSHLLSITPEEYLKERVESKIHLYSRLSRYYRTGYLIVGTLSILSSAAVPVLINIKVNPYIPILLSLLVTILVGSEKLFRFRDYWRNYDLTQETLKREKYLFQTRSGVYDNKEDETAFQLFVKRFEDTIKVERNQALDVRYGDRNDSN